MGTKDKRPSTLLRQNSSSSTEPSRSFEKKLEQESIVVSMSEKISQIPILSTMCVRYSNQLFPSRALINILSVNECRFCYNKWQWTTIFLIFWDPINNIYVSVLLFEIDQSICFGRCYFYNNSYLVCLRFNNENELAFWSYLFNGVVIPIRLLNIYVIESNWSKDWNNEMFNDIRLLYIGRRIGIWVCTYDVWRFNEFEEF